MEKRKRFSSVKEADSIQKKIQQTQVFLVVVCMTLLGVVACVLNYFSTYNTLKTSMNELAKIATDRVEWVM